VRMMIKRPVQRTPRRKLRAAAKKPARYAEDEYFVEEPNVKLSRAFVVVLLLHVVAVGGIFAFSTLKDRELSSSLSKKEPDATASPTSTPVAANRRSRAQAHTLIYKVKSGDTLAGVAAQFGLATHDLEVANNCSANAQLIAGRELIVPERHNEKAMPSDLQKLIDNHQTLGKPSPGSTNETGKVYIIQRGDNPASIAKKFKITANELLRTNNIDDPKRLQVGQRLLIPGKVD
jgi:LysM repeat protein